MTTPKPGFPFHTASYDAEHFYPPHQSYDFNTPLSFDEPLIPLPDSWPTFDYASLSHSLTSSPSSTASLPYPSSPEGTAPDVNANPPTASSSASASTVVSAQPSAYASRPSRGKPANHIPRPRNAFMIFRSNFWAQQKISGTVERDHRHISRIIAHCWHGLSDAEKQIWKDKADAEKAEHSQRHPGYRFAPVVRAQKPVKRRVRRNGKEDLKRCHDVAQLLLAGKQGDELESAVKEIEVTTTATSPQVSSEPASSPSASPEQLPSSMVYGWQPTSGNETTIVDMPVFRSPLLPPAQADKALTYYQSAPATALPGSHPPAGPSTMYDTVSPPTQADLDVYSSFLQAIASIGADQHITDFGAPAQTVPVDSCNDASPIFDATEAFTFPAGTDFLQNHYTEQSLLFPSPHSYDPATCTPGYLSTLGEWRFS